MSYLLVAILMPEVPYVLARWDVAMVIASVSGRELFDKNEIKRIDTCVILAHLVAPATNRAGNINFLSNCSRHDSTGSNNSDTTVTKPAFVTLGGVET